jgi:hypothetical protein
MGEDFHLQIEHVVCADEVSLRNRARFIVRGIQDRIQADGADHSVVQGNWFGIIWLPQASMDGNCLGYNDDTTPTRALSRNRGGARAGRSRNGAGDHAVRWDSRSEQCPVASRAIRAGGHEEQPVLGSEQRNELVAPQPPCGSPGNRFRGARRTRASCLALGQHDRPAQGTDCTSRFRLRRVWRCSSPRHPFQGAADLPGHR